jgi:hypothetical protein
MVEKGVSLDLWNGTHSLLSFCGSYPLVFEQ